MKLTRYVDGQYAISSDDDKIGYAPDHPEVLAWLESQGKTLQQWLDEMPDPATTPDGLRDTLKVQLAETDSDFSRFAEDLLAALVAKGVLTEADLEAVVQDKLKTRRVLRQQIAALS